MIHENNSVHMINEMNGVHANNEMNGVHANNEMNGVHMIKEKSSVHTIKEKSSIHTINEENATHTNTITEITPNHTIHEKVIPNPPLNTQAEATREKETTTPLSNPLAPRLTNPQLALTPSLVTLRAMTEEQLRHVEHASIACAGIGRVDWEEPVDLRRLDLDALVSFAVEDGYPTVAVGLRRGSER